MVTFTFITCSSLEQKYQHSTDLESSESLLLPSHFLFFLSWKNFFSLLLFILCFLRYVLVKNKCQQTATLQRLIKQLLSSLMKVSKIAKKRSNESHNPGHAAPETASISLRTRKSLIFPESKTQFMHGLLALVEKKAVSLCESFQEDQRGKKPVDLVNQAKNDVKANPFLMVKAKLLKQKESLETENTSSKGKGQSGHQPEDGLFEDKRTITFKELRQLENKQRAMLRPMTDRN